jgi:hypothetical protein
MCEEMSLCSTSFAIVIMTLNCQKKLLLGYSLSTSVHLLTIYFTEEACTGGNISCLFSGDAISTFGRDTNYPEWDLSYLFSVPPVTFLKTGHDRLLFDTFTLTEHTHLLITFDEK